LLATSYVHWDKRCGRTSERQFRLVQMLCDPVSGKWDLPNLSLRALYLNVNKENFCAKYC